MPQIDHPVALCTGCKKICNYFSEKKNRYNFFNFSNLYFSYYSSSSQNTFNPQSQSQSSQSNRAAWLQQQQHHLQQQQQQQHSKEQSESAMLFNYLYKSGTLPQAAYAQNAYGFTSEQMKQMQMYAGHNVDLLTSYYQQQQQYNQFLQVSVHYHMIRIF